MDKLCGEQEQGADNRDEACPERMQGNSDGPPEPIRREKEVIGSYTIEPIGTDCMGRVVARLSVALTADKDGHIDPAIQATVCPAKGLSGHVSYQWGREQGTSRILDDDIYGDSWDQAYDIARSRVTRYVEFLWCRREMERDAPAPETADLIV